MAALLYGVMRLFGSADPLLVHLVPVALGTLAVPFACAAARRLGGGRGAGLLAAFLVAVSPMAIHYSREGRPYALFILLSAAAYVAFLRARESNAWAAWLAFGVLLALSGLTHLLTLEVVLVLGLFSLVDLAWPRAQPARARVGRLLRLGLVTAVGSAAGVWWSFTRVGFGRAFEGVYPPGPLVFLRDALGNLGPGPVRPHVGGLPAWVTVALLLAYFALFAAGLHALARGGRRDAALLLALAVAVPLLVKYGSLGARKANWDWARWTTHALLPYLVGAAVGADALRRRLGAPLLGAALALLTAGVLPSSLEPFHRGEYAEYQAAAAQVAAHAGELRGVLVPAVDWRRPGPADERITDVYHLLKTDTLPVFHLADGAVRRLEMVPSRGGLTRLARPRAPAESALEPGAYAVLSRRPLTDCAELAGRFAGLPPAAVSTTPRARGLTVCAFAPAAGP
jgi:hypothetical protein